MSEYPKRCVLVVEDGVVKLFGDYHKEFMAQVKDIVPNKHRSWDPDARCWEVSEDYFSTLEELAGVHFSYVHVVRAVPVQRNSSHEATRLQIKLETANSEIEALKRTVTALQTRMAGMSVRSNNSSSPIEQFLNKEDAARVYKILASRHHPDRGGNHNVMVALNRWFEKWR